MDWLKCNSFSRRETLSSIFFWRSKRRSIFFETIETSSTRLLIVFFETKNYIMLITSNYFEKLQCTIIPLDSSSCHGSSVRLPSTSIGVTERRPPDKGVVGVLGVDSSDSSIGVVFRFFEPSGFSTDFEDFANLHHLRFAFLYL